MKINQIIINELSESAQPGVATTTAQTPQAQAAAQAIQKGLEKLQQQSPGLDHSFNTTTAIQEILPDGTVVMDSNLQPSALQNVRKILALGGGANFKVSMSRQGIPSAANMSTVPPAQPQPGVAEGDKKPYPTTWHDVDPKLGKRVGKMSQAEKVKKGLAHPDTLKKQGVAEGDVPFRGVGGAFKRGDNERHDLDPTDWYIVKDGEMFVASIYPKHVQQAISQGFSRTQAKAQSRADSQDMTEGSLNEFAPGGEDGNSPYAYGMAILGYAEDYKQIHGKSSSTNDDVADILEIGNIFLNKGMAPGIAALFSVDTFVSDSIVADLAEQGFNVMADLIDKRPRSAQWHQQMAAGQQALADYEANRKKSSEETDSSKAVDTLARVLKSSLQDYQAAAGDKNKLKQLGLLIGLSDNHRSAIHHALQQIQQNDFDGAIKSLVATPPGASGPGYDALDYGYSKQKAGISVQQLIQSIRKHFELSEQGVAEMDSQSPKGRVKSDEDQETPQQQQVRAAITKGMAKWDQSDLATYKSQPTNRHYFAASGWASGQLDGINSIDPDGTVVIELNDTTTAGLVKKLASLGGMPGVKTRQLKMTFDPAKMKNGVTQGDVSEAGNANSGRRGPNFQDNSPAIPGRVEPLPQGLKHHADASRYGGTEPNVEDDRLLGPASRHRLHQAVTPDDWFDESQEKIAGRHDPDDFDNMVGRLKQLAGAGPLKTVWDPARRVYRNVPHAVQPPQQPKKAKQ